jgi:hypothetical protein
MKEEGQGEDGGREERREISGNEGNLLVLVNR